MQERTPLWPLEGIWEEQSVLPWVSTLHPSQPGLVSEHCIPCRDWVQHPYPAPTGRPASLSHPDLLGASPGASPQLQSQFPQGLVQLIMHQVDLLSSQPEELHLAQGNSSVVTADLPRGVAPTQGSLEEGPQLPHLIYKEIDSQKYPRPCSNGLSRPLAVNRSAAQNPLSGPCALQAGLPLVPSTHRPGPRCARWRS